MHFLLLYIVFIFSPVKYINRKAREEYIEDKNKSKKEKKKGNIILQILTLCVKKMTHFNDSGIESMNTIQDYFVVREINYIIDENILTHQSIRRWIVLLSSHALEDNRP